MGYTDLRRSIEVWSGNTSPDFLSEINRFIRQAESRIGMLRKLPNYQQTASIAISSAGTAVPAGLISVDFISLPVVGILEQKSRDFIREAFPDFTVVGTPRYFAMQDDKTIVWGPPPDTTYTGTIGFFKKWPSLVDLNEAGDGASDTFISANFETALLHGSLYYAALFMQNAELSALEKTEMEEGLGLVNRFGAGRAKKQEAEQSDSAAAPGELS